MNQVEFVAELELPSRMEQIKSDFGERKWRAQSLRRPNPLHVLREADSDSNDELYDLDEGAGACRICHK